MEISFLAFLTNVLGSRLPTAIVSQRFFSPYFEITINTKCQIVLRHIVSKYQCADEEMNSMKI